MFLYFNGNIPDEAHQKISSMGSGGVSAFAFTPSGGWVLVARNNGYFARGIPDECFQKLGTFISSGDQVRSIAFTPHGGWVIVTNRNYFAQGIPDACFAKLGEYFKAGIPISCVAFPPHSDGWVILAGSTLYAHDINDECYQYLCNCLSSTRTAKQVVFTPSGGWAVLAEDYYWARNIPDECFQKLNDFHSGNAIVDHLAFSATGGWSIIADQAIPRRAPDTIRTIESQMIQIGGHWHSIWDRMAYYKVPGVSVAVVLENRIAWACNYGRIEAGSSDFVHSETVFQACSVSKPVAAVGFLQLVQDNLIGLDDDVTQKLTWSLPECSLVQSRGWKPMVTLRLLLQHNGGISGDVQNPDACNNFGGSAATRMFPASKFPH